ncbi:TlpA family protein disulfide reductase [Pedobacter chitinilyticus]|uniref:TlpA family protein disulfide reductase n=1 Tax=Pedobacter chitinilyticus TaxID=2233776 RepID=A0A443YVY8_9SPHI|nr:TlpA disulfide reductase family protein [Pedobacter chitinilyticus]RWU08145.1 TlpA family protein disulfide reductase [Pedobacter chitinilyticus]
MLRLKIMLVLMTFLVPAIALNSNAQNHDDDEVDYPKVGEQIKDHTFTDLENFPKKEVKISDFRGKWLILDVWGYACGSCILSFPKMNKLAKQFEKRVQLIMVGEYSKTGQSYKRTKDTFADLKREHELTFTVAYDSTFYKKYDVKFEPFILVIDPSGKIVAKTKAVDETQLTELLQGKNPAFTRAFSKHEKIEYNESIPLLTTGTLANGGIDTAFLSRSLLMRFNHNIPYLFQKPLTHKDSEAVKTGHFEVSKIGLSGLYKFAYFGSDEFTFGSSDYIKFNTNLALEVKDKKPFFESKATLEGLYAYSLKIPKKYSSTNSIMHAIQNDLSRNFPYNITIEKRKAEVYKLIVIDSNLANNIKTKGNTSSSFIVGKVFSKGYSVTNKSIAKFLVVFLKCLPPKSKLIDRTGIEFNVDMQILANMYIKSDVNNALKQLGLQIVSGFEDFETIVVRDK